MTNTTFTLAFFDDWLRSIWLKPGNSDLAPSVDGLFMYILWVCIISFIMLMVPMIYWTFRWRRLPGVPPIRTPNHNTALEVTWVVVPLLVVTVIFFWGFHGYMNSQIAKGNAEVINVTGAKWNWTPMYANGAGSGESVYLDDNTTSYKDGDKAPGVRGVNKFPVIVVPEGIPIKFMLMSKDVMHSFYIPDMRLKMDAFPNRYTSMTFIPQDSDPAKSEAGKITKTPGTAGRDHYIFCAEYCGENHSEMAGILRVLPQDLYKKTIEEWGNIIDTVSLVDAGKFVYEKRGCAQCHSLDGKDGTGPTWKGYYGKAVEFSQMGGSAYDLTTEDGWNNYIRESILYPSMKIHKGFANQMPSYSGQLSDRAILGVAAYIRSLNGMTKPDDMVTPEKKK